MATTTTSPTIDPPLCLEQSKDSTVATWILFAFFMFLCLFGSRVITRIIFLAAEASLRSYPRVRAVTKMTERKMGTPIYLLFAVMFAYLAYLMIPWPPCSLHTLKRIILIVILALALIFGLWAVLRLFDVVVLSLPLVLRNDPVSLSVIRDLGRAAQFFTVLVLGVVFYVHLVRYTFPDSIIEPIALFYTESVITGIISVTIAIPLLREIIGGITFLVDRPFDVGDAVEIGPKRGVVASIGLFAVTLNSTLDNGRSVVPCGQLVSSVCVKYSTRVKVAFQVPLPLSGEARRELWPGNAASRAHIRSLLARVDESLRSSVADERSDAPQQTLVPEVDSGLTVEFVPAKTSLGDGGGASEETCVLSLLDCVSVSFIAGVGRNSYHVRNDAYIATKRAMDTWLEAYMQERAAFAAGAAEKKNA